MKISAYHGLLVFLFRVIATYLENRNLALPTPKFTDLELIEMDTQELRAYVDKLRSNMYS